MFSIRKNKINYIYKIKFLWKNKNIFIQIVL